MRLEEFHKKAQIVMKEGYSEADMDEDPGSFLYETQEEMIAALSRSHTDGLVVYTLYDRGPGMGYIAKGVHIVNRLGYILCRKEIVLRPAAYLGGD